MNRVYLLIVFIFVTSSLQLMAKPLKQGQETWGGDVLALNFVKMARIISLELESNKKCKSVFPATLEKWSQKVEHTTVESIGKSLPSMPGHILVNRYTFWDLRLDWKVEKVLLEYFSQLGVTVDSTSAKPMIQNCIESRFWKTVLRPEKITQDRKKDEESEIRDLSEELAQQLRSGGMKRIDPYFDHKKFEDIVIQIKSGSKANRKMKWNLRPISFLFPNNSFKDAQNSVNEKNLSLEINSSYWKLLSKGQKKELLFHEILGLIRKDDHLYNLSSQLFLTLPISEYESE